MVIKGFGKSVSFDQKALTIKRVLFKHLIEYNEILKIVVNRPHYIGIPGSGFSYITTFSLKTIHFWKTDSFSFVFNEDDKEYRNIIDFLKTKVSVVEERFYDNRFSD
jgi:hypothetical protein